MYSYVHLAHVLEHLVQPLELVRRVVNYIQPGGYLYVEVPQEIPDADLRRLQEGKGKTELHVHEHINAYSTSAVRKLFRGGGAGGGRDPGRSYGCRVGECGAPAGAGAEALIT